MATKGKSQIGLVGLAVMGQNLVLNLLDHGYTVSVFNRTYSKTQEMVSRYAPSYEGRLQGFESPAEFVQSLEKPRKILLMVKAGSSVDETIAQFLPYLDRDDVIIDGGNSLYRDSERRESELAQKGLHFVGCGISGGEEGARRGPSMMPSGSLHAKKCLIDIFQSIAAKDWAGGPCCDWIGPSGSGHFVKMVHNGIEYGDMQLICETYDIMKRGLGASGLECQRLFEHWKSGPLDSYLIDITAQILSQLDSDGSVLVDKILDEAGQKGTGRWTVEESLLLGVPLTLISQAVFARQLSARRDLRDSVRSAYSFAQQQASKEIVASWDNDLAQALYAAKLISYAQGFSLMFHASQERKWDLHLAEIARIWSGGCIIRSRFLKDIHHAYEHNPPKDLLIAPYFVKQLPEAIASLRKVLKLALDRGIPTSTLSSALNYFDSLCSDRLPANLLQAQRDYFGAHTYQRVDQPRDQYFHTDWAQTGTGVSSSSYNA